MENAIAIAAPTCEGCGCQLGAFEAMRWSVCFDCTKARHRAAMSHRCSCGKKRREVGPHKVGWRVWFSCVRCLGTTRQVS